MNRDTMFYRLRLLAALLLPLALLACNSSGTSSAASDQPPLAGASIGGPFTLVDKNGNEVHWSDFKGQYRIVYFGYTYCPDACPTDVGAMMAGFHLFEKAHPDLAKKVQPIFISIDPARDTPKVVGEWTAAFGPRLMGLTGKPEEIARAAREFAVHYAKGEETDGGYLMDHSRAAYLMGPDGQPIALLPVTDGPQKKAAQAVEAQLEKWVK